jgi:ubiquinone/menaquinone biosynthesis C-methylase UbiE
MPCRQLARSGTGKSNMTASPQITGSRQEAANSYFQNNPSFWKDIYEHCSLQSAIYQARRTMALQFFESLSTPRDSRIIEIGCGAGILAVDIALRGYSISAIDTAPAMLDLTSTRASDSGVRRRVDIRLGDIHKLDFADRSLDVVFAIGVLPWVPALPVALAELARVLKPGGHCIVTVDNGKRLSHRLDPLLPARRAVGRLLRRMNLRDSVISCTHTPEETDQSLRAAGLVKRDACTLGFGPFTLGGFHLLPERTGARLGCFLQKKADRINLLSNAGAQYVVLAQRIIG